MISVRKTNKSVIIGSDGANVEGDLVSGEPVCRLIVPIKYNKTKDLGLSGVWYEPTYARAIKDAYLFQTHKDNLPGSRLVVDRIIK